MKILKVKNKNLSEHWGSELPPHLKVVLSNRFVKNKYTHIKLSGVVYTAKITKAVFGNSIVWLDKQIS
jgi:hypothetical protein